jgi:PAS domain S-box-containing protein
MSEPAQFSAPFKLQLAYSEERLRLLVESVTDYAIFMLDPEGYIISWNAGAERIKGYSEAEVIGKHISLFYTPEDIAANHPQEAIDQALKQGRYEEEGWRVRKDGSRFWSNVIITPVVQEDGALRGFAKVTRDLTQRQQLEDREQSFALLVDRVQDYAIFMLDPTGHVTSWNQGAERIKGYTADDIVGQHISRFYTAEDLARNHPEKELEAAVRDGRHEDEGWRVRKDGSRFWANVVITPLFKRDGTLSGFAKVTRDITQRQEMEDQLHELNRQLEAFAYSVAHDLRVPLRAIAFTSHILLDEAAQNLSEEHKDLLNRQYANAVKLAQIVDDLLRMARISSEELRRTEIDLSAVASEIAKEVSGKENGSRCTFSVEPGIHLNADPTLIHVILLNLIGNAYKFSPDGGAISIGYDPANNCCFVRDEGVGFDMAYADKVFLAFERLVRDEEFEGTGIGLANVKLAVLRHRGKIWVESELGKGTTFYFTLGG